ncbi:uncharacterized protein LOC116348474 [Contarinia nasturtii]|uniref:uncharacterized protein LOC116348474 n=1 Tax=Contarinia nasturtii TaxID=265458 RepID=UPI0012D422FF|nr:uncharacterized protein LOC116348474 [Contarinia nasturtii]
MFSLNTSSKGHYPHYFNTAENFNYVGPIPNIEYYDPDSMKPKDKQKFIEWYNEESANNILFDNKRELIAYCVQDVTILRLACLKFRSMMIPLTHVDPFNQVTVASTCMKVYKTNFLEENMIPILPRHGYRLRDNQSFKAINWLEWEAHNRNINIISASNGREVRINEHIVVDGYHEPTRTVFSFHGCWWHMCKKCYPFQHHTLPGEKKMPASVLYDNTMLRAEKIRSLGYNLIEIWEHEFDQLVRDMPVITEYLSTLPHLKSEPLVPRDAFFGGRTGVCRLYHKCSPGEKIHYYDVTSLYPYINKYCEYPVGIPTVLLGDKLKNRNVFNINGLIKCRIIPPRNLIHPVLPIKMDNYLMFVLCRECGEKRNENDCIHTEDERSFIGTYVSNELCVAVEKGYKIDTIYEAWNYKMSKYNKITKSGGLFSEYVNLFLKIKTEASGFPPGVESDEQKNEYIKHFFDQEGILLEKDKISYNEGLRALAKIMLNSFWGRYGMKPNKSKKCFISQRDELLELITNPSTEVQSLFPLSDTSLLASYRYHDICAPIQPDVNVVIAAYTTAQARIHLYRYLDKLGDRVLYYDTDSVIYTQKENETGLELGNLLGELTDELAKDYGVGSYITESVISSEKSYALRIISPNNEENIICKVKGITLNQKNTEIINFNTLKQMVLRNHNSPDDIVKLVDRKILRTKDSYVFSTETEYSFKVNAKKRKRVGNERILTLPFGW